MCGLAFSALRQLAGLAVSHSPTCPHTPTYVYLCSKSITPAVGVDLKRHGESRDYYCCRVVDGSKADVSRTSGVAGKDGACLMQHSHGNGLSKDEAFRAIEPVVDSHHLPAYEEKEEEEEEKEQ